MFHLQYSFLVTINMHKTINTLNIISLSNTDTNLPRRKYYKPVTIWKNYFGQWSPMCDSDLTMQLRSTGSCEPTGRVQITHLVGYIAKGLETFKVSKWNGTSGLLWPFIIIYKEFKFFLHTYIHKTLNLTPILHTPKID